VQAKSDHASKARDRTCHAPGAEKVDIFGVQDGQVVVGEVKASASEFRSDEIQKTLTPAPVFVLTCLPWPHVIELMKNLKPKRKSSAMAQESVCSC
jgi:hypothetical protein